MISCGRTTGGWTGLSARQSITKRCKTAAAAREGVAARGCAADRRMSAQSRTHENASVFHRKPGVVSLRKAVRVDSAADSAFPGGANDGNEEIVKDLEAGTQGSNPSLVPVIVSVCIAAMGAFLFGYHLGVVNGPLEQIAADLNFAGNTVLQGSVVSTLLAGAAVGALSGGALADAIGRRMTLIADTLLLITGALLCANAGSLNAMLLGRLVAGVGIGISSGVVPLYISEVAPTAIRGALGSVNQLVICFGILAALVVNVVLPPTSWPLMFTAAAIPAVVLAVGMFFSPESPRWLASHGQTAKAQEVMVNLWGKAEPMKDTKTESASSAPSIMSPGNIRILAIGCSLFLFQQFSGINAIVYFSSKVFFDAGLVSGGALASAVVGATNVLGTMFATGLMDRAGRKQLLTYSYLGMGLSMLAMAAGFALPALGAYSGSIALIGTVAYIMSFGLGVGPVPALLVPEISPADLRGTAVSCAMTTHWVANFGIGQLFLPAVATYGVSKVYVFFSAVCFAAIVFTSKFLVETKGKSLEEISKEMGA